MSETTCVVCEKKYKHKEEKESGIVQSIFPVCSKACKEALENGISSEIEILESAKNTQP